MNFLYKSLLVVTAFVTSVALSSVGFAQEQSQMDDKTGTNPDDFSSGFRVSEAHRSGRT
ncbi:MAG: hypothetical protein O6844_02595 [Gammaproteobacteria bacterium]|nr:hypothetical protein [Gammaproteobacteria bacterium]